MIDRTSDYPTCERCYATLCVYTGDLAPTRVTKGLGVDPSCIAVKGERVHIASERINEVNGWFLSSNGVVDSRDLRDHLDWLFDRIECHKDGAATLRELGCVFLVSCYWLSREGHGGPILSAQQLKALVELESEIWLDVYFLGEE
jgi:Domain of unknown function (DUF4279)